MHAWRNDILRSLLNLLFKILAVVIRVENFFLRKRKNPLFKGEPSSYEGQVSQLEATFVNMKVPKSWAKTSGTRNEPKKIPYDRARIKLVQKTFLKALITLTSGYSGKKTFFVFSSLEEDQSLTSGLLDSSKDPGLLALLQAPYRYLQTTPGKVLLDLCGGVTARLIILVVTRPKFLYATNPSTLTHFFNQIHPDWETIKKGICEFLAREDILPPLLKLSCGDGVARLEKLCALSEPPLVSDIISDVQAFITWDGGYVGIFVEQLKEKFPHIAHIPMFSMSTEAIETVPHSIKGEIYFLPTAPKTYAEFLDINNGRILQASELKRYGTYGLLITDTWGMNRYDTQDIFYVQDIVSGLPDLRFKKRRGITVSLTGEKITEEQVVILSQQLKKDFPSLAQTSISLFPSEKNGKFNYQLIIIESALESSSDLLARSEELLKDINPEYCSKVTSGRLDPLSLQFASVSELASIMGNPLHWESQFKVLPLYEKIIRRD